MKGSKGYFIKNYRSKKKRAYFNHGSQIGPQAKITKLMDVTASLITSSDLPVRSMNLNVSSILHITANTVMKDRVQLRHCHVMYIAYHVSMQHHCKKVDYARA